MQLRPIGQSGIEASTVILGTWAIGGWMWGGAEEKESIAAIHAALDAGVTCIDTAPVYGFGLSEEVVGKAIEGIRDSVVIATKCGLAWNTKEGEFFFNSDGKAIHRLLRRDAIRAEVEMSLRRMKIDHIDLLQTHWQDSTTPIEETMVALLELKKEGKIRAIGVCNATGAQMDEYRRLGPLDSDQEKYSMLDRGIEEDQLPYCQQHGIAVLAYSPLALGLLTGKIGPEREFPEGDLRRGNPRFSVENRRRVADMLGEMQPIAKERGLSLTQLVIAWTLAQPGMTHALVGARNAQQARENAKAGQVELTDEEIGAINRIFDANTDGIV